MPDFLPLAFGHSSRSLRSRKTGLAVLHFVPALRVRLVAFAAAFRRPWKAAVAARTTEGGKTMNRLNTTDSFLDLTWDEYVIEVEDNYLLETGDDIDEDQYADIVRAYDRGLSPIGCAIALMDLRRHQGRPLAA
ncbi:hypothetical protein SL003B_0629 [Polymorphum gilvum SL003B-26A1]|uniref:Uncharacterized protein n=2 Tax=Polymorphum TaxID=991903 RepID=F2J4X0_POLGS|nr:hypothetical protein SL003B_0629 [Polymorphum gilvum SL003B-26A1]